MNVPFTYKFQSLSDKFLYEFLKLIRHISLPRLGHLLYKKGNFKFSD